MTMTENEQTVLKKRPSPCGMLEDAPVFFVGFWLHYSLAQSHHSFTYAEMKQGSSHAVSPYLPNGGVRNEFPIVIYELYVHMINNGQKRESHLENPWTDSYGEEHDGRDCTDCV